MIVGIILSAGESRRMGTPKQLLPWGRTVMLQRVLDAASDSRLDAIMLILGYRADEIASRVALPPRSRALVNLDYREGMSSSVKCGVKHLPDDAEALMLLLGDQPLIGPDVIDKLIDLYHETKRGIIIPTYGGRRGHPVVFSSRYRQELLSISDKGAREVVHRHSADVFEVPLDAPGILTDIDTPEEYREARKQIGDDRDE